MNEIGSLLNCYFLECAFEILHVHTSSHSKLGKTPTIMGQQSSKHALCCLCLGQMARFTKKVIKSR
jgi:hypothetical protein